VRLEKRHWELLCASSVAQCNPLETAATASSARDSADLSAAGLWPALRGGTAHAEDRSNLCRFAARHGMVVDLFEVPGGVLAASNLNLGGLSGRGPTTVNGQGFSALQAVLSCLGEAVEFASWLYRPQDRRRLAGLDAAGEQPGRISARHVLGFSERQVGDREKLNRTWGGWDVVPTAGDMEEPEHWATVHDLSGARSALCPAFLCYGRFGDRERGDPGLNADSNGSAAGRTPEEARRRAVLELVERDATGIWWWRGCRRARIAAETLEDAELAAALARHRDDTGRKLWFLDISTFRSASVVAAVSCAPSGRQLAAGFAAALSRRDAVRSAFLEMLQTELSMDAHEIRMEDGVPGSASDGRISRWLDEADLAALDFLTGSDPSGTLPERAAALPELVDEMAAAGHEVWFSDLSRPDIGVPVVKAIAAGLAHYKPRFGCPRLGHLPGQRGWETAYSDRLNPIALVI
jgi:thiazole/oxazole-forming peptide maturase SagD family component